MTICYEIDDIVKFPIKGSFADRTGKDQPFSFTLTCERVDPEVIDEFLKNLSAGGKISDFFLAEGVSSEYRTHGWSGVKSKTGAEVPFSADELQKLFRLPGIPVLVWRRYLEEIQAKAKN
jgi:hypothetical protein